MPLVVGVGADAVADRLAERAVFPQQRDAQVADRLVQPLGQIVDDEIDRGLAVSARRRADLERVFEAAPRDDLGGAGRFPVEHAMALGRLAHRNGERRGERAGGDLDAFLGDQPLGFADRGVRIGGVALQVFDLAAVDAAALVDHVARDLHRFPVFDAVLGERPGQRQQHADPDRLLRHGGYSGQRHCGAGDHRKQAKKRLHGELHGFTRSSPTTKR